MNPKTPAKTGVPDRAELLARARRIGAILEANAEETDRLRHLADANVQALRETGLCRLMAPRRVGGDTARAEFIVTVAPNENGIGTGAAADTGRYQAELVRSDGRWRLVGTRPAG